VHARVNLCSSSVPWQGGQHVAHAHPLPLSFSLQVFKSQLKQAAAGKRKLTAVGALIPGEMTVCCCNQAVLVCLLPRLLTVSNRLVTNFHRLRRGRRPRYKGAAAELL
jgi:hypothetical protein